MKTEEKDINLNTTVIVVEGGLADGVEDQEEILETGNSNSTNNKRIAKNAVMLYIRMLLSTIVSLYTSRIIIDTLGIDDYGVYSIVGGIVAMMGFLNASMSGATSRFLTFELGKRDKEKLKKTFSSAVLCHLAIALVIFILAETVGLWFLNNKLVIPQESMIAAHWVYQFSILSTVISITQVPYNASIIAHEKMDIYAYMEILNVLLKLVIVYILVIGDFNKLILYAFLVLVVSTLIALLYRWYCIYKFEECRFEFVIDKSILKPMLTFSGWDLYGNGCVTARQQGTNMLINMFFGVALNAAGGVASTITGVVGGFTENILTAFRPAIIKSYSAGNITAMQTLINRALVGMVVMFSCMAVPLYLELDFVLGLWLVEVPPYTVAICKVIIFSLMIGLINSILCVGIHATGNIFLISFLSGSIFLITLPAIYIVLNVGGGVVSVYYIHVVSISLITAANMIILKHLIPTLKMRAIIFQLFKLVFVVGVSIIPVVLFKYYLIANINSFVRLILEILIYIMTIGLLSYYNLLDSQIRAKIKSKFKLRL